MVSFTNFDILNDLLTFLNFTSFLKKIQRVEVPWSYTDHQTLNVITLVFI